MPSWLRKKIAAHPDATLMELVVMAAVGTGLDHDGRNHLSGAPGAPLNAKKNTLIAAKQDWPLASSNNA